MKYLLSAFLLALSFAPLAAQADIAPDPGTHEWSTHAMFDNLADYPRYDVYVSENWRFGPSLVLASDAVAPTPEQALGTGHPSSEGTPFIAVKQSNQAKIFHQDDPGQEHGDLWDILPENQQYFIKAVVTGQGADMSKETLMNGSLPDSNHTNYIAYVYHIDSLTDTAFTVHFVSESRLDKTGVLISGPNLSKASISTDQIIAGVPALPAPFDNGNNGRVIVASPAVAMSPFALIWIVIVCMGAIILALAIKTWKK
ncbi:MAG: hypothetical protein WC802_00230 [Patescibacteria group bacterium]|jgi:hypothetical protein